MRFFREFVMAPRMTGAIAPSSRHLARAIVRRSGVPLAPRIIEVGPGTGAFTERILAEKPADARFVVIERNPNFASHLEASFPGLRVVTGCASRLAEHASEHDVHGASSIVCGLPWAAFARPLQTAILGAVHEVLGTDGVFATFAYFGPHWLPAGRRFRRLLGSSFRDVRVSPVVLRNVPPAFVYTCRK